MRQKKPLVSCIIETNSFRCFENYFNLCGAKKLKWFCIFYLSFVQFIKANIQTFDIWHANRTICVINGPNNDSPKDLTCFNVDDFSKVWKFPKPEVVTNLNCRYSLLLSQSYFKQQPIGNRLGPIFFGYFRTNDITTLK